MSVQIQLRRDLAAQWTLINPILAEGEMGLEIDMGRFKVGDGIKTWNMLSYSSGIQGEKGDTGVYVPTTETVNWANMLNLITSSRDLLRITLGGTDTNISLQPGADGQKLMLELKQGTGNNLVSWGSSIAFGEDIKSVTLSTEINKIDYVGLIYSDPANTWRLIAYSRGY